MTKTTLSQICNWIIGECEVHCLDEQISFRQKTANGKYVHLICYDDEFGSPFYVVHWRLDDGNEQRMMYAEHGDAVLKFNDVARKMENNA